VKSAATAAPDFFKGFGQIAERIQKAGLPLRLDNVVVYGGETWARFYLRRNNRNRADYFYSYMLKFSNINLRFCWRD